MVRNHEPPPRVGSKFHDPGKKKFDFDFRVSWLRAIFLFRWSADPEVKTNCFWPRSRNFEPTPGGGSWFLTMVKILNGVWVRKGIGTSAIDVKLSAHCNYSIHIVSVGAYSKFIFKHCNSSAHNYSTQNVKLSALYQNSFPNIIIHRHSYSSQNLKISELSQNSFSNIVIHRHIVTLSKM